MSESPNVPFGFQQILADIDRRRAETLRFTDLMHAQAMRDLERQDQRVLGIIPGDVWDHGWPMLLLAGVLGALAGLVITLLLSHDAALAMTVCQAAGTRVP